MPDYDPKIIPLLDDIIEDEGDEAASNHEKIIVSEEMQEDDSTLDMFNHATAEIDIAHNEPAIGAIEAHIGDETAIDIKAIETGIDETPDDEQAGEEAEAFESAVIDYTHEEDFEPASDLTSAATETNDSDTVNEPNDQTTDITAPVTTSKALNTLNIDTIIDDVVNQILPELEQTLRTRLKQALEEQLPSDGIEPTVSE